MLLLINGNLNLCSQKLQYLIDKKQLNLTAREYPANLKNTKNVEVVQATNVIPCKGSKC